MKVIKVGAVWCPSCLIMRPRWDKIEKELNLESVFFDFDTSEEKLKKYNIGETLPVAILENDAGEEIYRFVGEKSEKEIIKVIEELTREKNSL